VVERSERAVAARLPGRALTLVALGLLGGAGVDCAALTSWDSYVGGGPPDAQAVDASRPDVSAGDTPPPSSYSLGGTLTGLASGSAVTLADGNGGTVALTTNGAFTFPGTLPEDRSYKITIVTQPTGESCVVENAAGTVGAMDVADVVVSCSDGGPPAPDAGAFTIGGVLEGLSQSMGEAVTLTDGTTLVTLSGNGPFTFPSPVATGSSYEVAVKVQPGQGSGGAVSQTCSVVNGSGTVESADVTDVRVTCVTDMFTVGGTLTGLPPGDSVELEGTGAGPVMFSTDGPFMFPPSASGTSYDVVVVTSFGTDSCTVDGGTGTVGSSDVTSVVVTCSAPDWFSIGGTVLGLSNGQVVVLENNGTDDLTLTGTGGDLPFAFPTPEQIGMPYDVSIFAQPSAQACKLSGQSGIVNGNTLTVIVACQ